jgi:hypothetical protein
MSGAVPPLPYMLSCTGKLYISLGHDPYYCRILLEDTRKTVLALS